MSLIYPGGDEQVTPNIGLSTWGMDEVLANNMILIDAAISGGGSSVKVNSVSILNPNFNNTTPAAPGGNSNVTWQVDVSGNVSAYVSTSGTGTVTSFSAGNLSPLFTTSVATSTTTPALSFALSNAAGGTVLGNNGTSAGAPAYTIAPVLGIPGTSTGTIALASSTASGKYTLTAPANAATPTLTLPTTSNVLAGQFAGDGTVLSSTLSTASSAGTLTAALANAGGGTVLGNNTTGSAAPAYTISPVLGIPGTSTGTIALASSTASGEFTITAPASAATPTLTLSTSSGVVVNVADGIVFTATIAANGTLALATQTANTVFAGPSSAGPSAPTFRALVAADIPNSTIMPIWNNLQNATGALTLANGANATTFNQTSNVAWLWANTTVATSGTTNASPLLEVAANYWTGAASATDTWTIGSSLAAGTNGASTLQVTHTGSTGGVAVVFPAGIAGVPSVAVGSTATGMWQLNASHLILQMGSGTSASTLGLYSSTADAMEFQFNSGTGYAQWILQASGCVYAHVGNLTTQSGRSGIALGNPTLAGTTAGTQHCVSIGDLTTNTGAKCIFTPSSGATNFSAFTVYPTINQTGSASGSYTGITVNAIETSLKGTTNKLLSLQAGTTGGTVEFDITNAGVISTYNAIATVSNGVPSELANRDLTAQSAAITATTLYATTATGMYRVSWSATITTVDGVSSVLGGAGGFQVIYTSPTDSVVKTTVAGNSVTSSANTTGTAVGGCEVVYANTGTNIKFTYGYTSATPGQMVYELHIKVESLG